MMRGISESTTQSRWIVIGIGVTIALVGVLQYRNAPVDIYPEYLPTTVVVQTEAVGLSAAEVERLVAVPLEELLAPTPLLEELRSESVPGLSVIELEFQSGVDDLVARQLVQESLGSVFTLPNVTKPPVMIQPLSATNRVMTIGLTSDELSLIELSVLARWNITPRLLGVPGVANVAVWGQRDRQLQVQIDPDLMVANDVTLDQVVSTTGDALWVSTLSYLNASVPGTGGWIDTPTQRLGIRHVLPISSPEDLASVSVDGTTLSLGDIGEVVEGHTPIIGDAFIDNEPALLLVVEKFPGTNTLDVTRGVEAAMSNLQPGLTGVDVDTGVFRAATLIESAQSNLTLAGWLGAVVAIVVIGLLFLSWRVALIAIAAVTVSLTAAGLVLLQLGATLNVMVVTGLIIATSAVIADAMINAYSLMKSSTRQHADRAALLDSAMNKSRGPVVFGALIGALAVLPVFFLEGTSGAFYRPLALAYTLAVGASMVVALVVTPVLNWLILPDAPLLQRSSPVSTWLQEKYAKALAPLVRMRSVAVVTLVLLLVVSLAAGLNASGDPGSLPAFAERDLRVDLESDPATSPTAMAQMMMESSAALSSIPGVTNVSGQVGRAEKGDQTVGTNAGQLWVRIDADADYDGTLSAIQASLDADTDLDGRIDPYLTGQALNISHGSHDLVVRVYGQEIDVLNGVSDEVARTLSSVDGLTGVRVDTQPLEPQVEIEVDLTKAREHGIKPGDVRRAAAIYFAGIPVGNLFEEQKVFEVSVWSKPEARGSIENLADVLVDKPDGTRVRLGDVADVRMETIPTLIRHESASLYLDVIASVSGRNIDAIVADVDAVLATIEFPLEYNPQVRALAIDREVERTQQRALMFTALIGMLILLQLSLGTWRKALLGLVALPAALSGGFLAGTWFGDGVLSLGSLAGLLAVFGIAVRSGVLLINHLRDLEADEEIEFGPELAERAARERLSPIAMTALVPALALLPAVLLGGRAGLELVSTMGVVFLGGLITTLIVYLFVVPTLYLVVARPGNLGTDLRLETE